MFPPPQSGGGLGWGTIEHHNTTNNGHTPELKLMRVNWIALISAIAIFSSGLAFAAIDLSDFDDDVMRAMDDSFKDLEPVLGAGDATAAKNDIDVLLEGYQWTDDYFVKKTGADDAVKIARDGRALIQRAQAAINNNDLTGASALARDTAKNCKSCHDLYKPLTK